jgi:hypothetical protein
VVIPALMNVLVNIKDVCVSDVILRSLEDKIINQVAGVTTCDVTHEPLYLRDESNMAWFEAHSDGAISRADGRLSLIFCQDVIESCMVVGVGSEDVF